jgi:hypothetical protein
MVAQSVVISKADETVESMVKPSFSIAQTPQAVSYP